MPISALTDISGLVLDVNPHTGSYADTGGTTPASVDGAVARVNDFGGGAYHALQSTEGLRPLLKQDANGWKFLKFDGSDDYLAGSTFTPKAAGAHGFTIITVVRCTDTSAVHPIWLDGSQRDYRQRDSRDFQLSFGAAFRQGTPDTTRRNHVTIVNTTSSAIYIDGTIQGSTGDAGSSVWNAGYHIATRLSGTPGAIEVWRFAAYNKVLSGTEITDVSSYLAALYGSAPPSGGETYAGGCAVGFSFAAAPSGPMQAVAAASNALEIGADDSGALALPVAADCEMNLSDTAGGALAFQALASTGLDLAASANGTMIFPCDAGVALDLAVSGAANARYPANLLLAMTMQAQTTYPSDSVIAGAIQYYLQLRKRNNS